VPRHATRIDAIEAARDDAVKDVAGAWYKCSCLACHRTVCVDCRRVRRAPCPRLEVSRLVADVVISAKKAKAKTEVEGKSIGGTPVVLNVGLYDFITVVVFRLGRGLCELSDVSGQEISERISRGHPRRSAEGKRSLVVARRGFVFLGRDETGAEDKRMALQCLGEVVAIGIGRIRVLPREVACGLAESSAVCRVSLYRD
jgi:hypothetical protein